MMRVFSFKCSLSHDVKQRPQWRAGIFDRSIVEIFLRHALLGVGDVLDPVGKRIRVLDLRLEDPLLKYLSRIIKHAAEIRADEFRCDAISQSAGEDLLSLELVIAQRLQIPLLDEEIR